MTRIDRPLTSVVLGTPTDGRRVYWHVTNDLGHVVGHGYEVTQEAARSAVERELHLVRFLLDMGMTSVGPAGHG